MHPNHTTTEPPMAIYPESPVTAVRRTNAYNRSRPKVRLKVGHRSPDVWEQTVFDLLGVIGVVGEYLAQDLLLVGHPHQ